MNAMRRRLERMINESQDSPGLYASKGDPTWFLRYQRQIYGVLLLAVFITILFPETAKFQYGDLREGKVYIGPEIIAPYTFPVNKSGLEYTADVAQARSSIAPVFQRDSTIAAVQTHAAERLFVQMHEQLRKPSLTVEELRGFFEKNGVALAVDDLSMLINPVAAGAAENLNGVLASRLALSRSIQNVVLPLLKEMFSAGILNVEKKSLATQPGKISVRSNAGEMLEDANYYRGPLEAQARFLEQLRADSELNESAARLAYKIAVHFLAPNLFYNAAETFQRQEEAVANVPLAKDQVLAGERIIDSHQRITQEHIDKLNSLTQARIERKEASGLWSRFSYSVGNFFFTLLLLIILVVFLYKVRREIFDRPKQLLLLGVTILLTGLVVFLANELNLPALAVPVTMGVIIVVVFFDIPVALAYAVTINLLMGAMRGHEYDITFISFFVSLFAMLSSSRVRSRRWILSTMAAVMAAYLVGILVQDYLNYLSLKEISRDLGYGLINGFLSSIFAYGLIMILEYLFNMTTDMTLLELSDLNHPLMRQLALQAPGTYHHSLMVGNLSEAAAEAIGGNGLLARGGAYYHDIGKMEKPEYFVENQARGRNPQEKLTPTMSSLVLLNHVRKGSEMARTLRLPQVVAAFIEEHHGTSLMSFFYQKAVEQNKGEYVSDTEFRYPGPRPQSKETAIVMLADAVEATSRTLKEPSPSRIKQMVDHMIDERFKSGELDESPLTLQDLTKISLSFQKILNGLFHRRIEYPKSGPTQADEEDKHEDQNTAQS
ncbi:HDIG domain-containing protein [bacterium]|nr:HDIG domain-containing protein [bacterium]